MKKLNISFEEGRKLLYERMAAESIKPETEEEKKIIWRKNKENGRVFYRRFNKIRRERASWKIFKDY